MCDSVWNDCVKPRIAAELGLPNATSSIYDAVVKIVEDLSVSDEQLKGIEAGDGIIVTETQDSYIISAEVARLTGTGAVSVEEVQPGQFTISAPPRQWQESRSTVGAKSVATLRPIANPTDITGVVATNSFSLSSSVNSTAYQIGRYYEWDDESFLSLNQEEDSWAHGHPVTLRGNKIALAQQGDRVIGVTCPHLGFVSGAHEFEWQGKYVRNAFGALQTRVTHVSDMVSLLSTRRDEQQAELCLSLVEKLHSLDGPDVLDKLTLEEKELVAGAKVVPVAVPVLSPGYDQGREYVGRRHRKEWVPVCYKGEVRVRTSSLNLLGGCHVLESGDQVTVVNL